MLNQYEYSLGTSQKKIHIFQYCGDTIAGVSLSSDCVMRLRHKNMREEVVADIHLPRWSLYKLRCFTLPFVVESNVSEILVESGGMILLTKCCRTRIALSGPRLCHGAEEYQSYAEILLFRRKRVLFRLPRYPTSKGIGRDDFKRDA